MTSSRNKLAILGVGLAIVAAGFAMLLAPSLYEVVDKGHGLRPYDSGPVYQLRIADSVTVYAAEESQPDMDAVSGSALVALATAALMTLLLLRAAGEGRRLRRFYAISTLGLAYLAADELFAIHETVGHNLVFLSDIPGVERPDDAIIAAYAIPAVAFLVYFRDVLLDSPRATLFFGAAIALFLVAGASDLAGLAADELFEVLSAACIVGGFVSLIVAHLTARLGLEDRVAPARETLPRRRDAAAVPSRAL